MQKIKNFFLNEISFFVSLPALLWQILFFFIPLMFIIYLGFTDKAFLSFTLNNFIAVLDITHLSVIFRSIILALFVSILCLLIAYPVAYFLAFRTERWKSFYLFLLTLPLWVNFLVQVYAWFFVLEKQGIINKILLSSGLISQPLHMINNLFAIVIVMVHVYLPFMILPLYNVLEKFDVQLIEASLDLGASKWTTFFRVTFPLSLSGVYLGFFLVFVMSFGEVVIPLLMGGNKNLFAGTLISEYFLGARNMPHGSAFTFLSTVIMILILLLLYKIFKKRVKG